MPAQAMRKWADRIIGHCIALALIVFSGGCPPTPPPPAEAPPAASLSAGVAYVAWGSRQVKDGPAVSAIRLEKQSILWRLDYACSATDPPRVRGDELIVATNASSIFKSGRRLFANPGRGPRGFASAGQVVAVDRQTGRPRRVLPAPGVVALGESCFWSSSNEIVDLKDGRTLGKVPEEALRWQPSLTLAPDVVGVFKFDTLLAFDMRTGRQFWAAPLPEPARPRSSIAMDVPSGMVQGLYPGRALVALSLPYRPADRSGHLWMIDIASGATIWITPSRPLVLEQDEQAILMADQWSPRAEFLRVDLSDGRTTTPKDPAPWRQIIDACPNPYGNWAVTERRIIVATTDRDIVGFDRATGAIAWTRSYADVLPKGSKGPLPPLQVIAHEGRHVLWQPVGTLALLAMDGDTGDVFELSP